MSETETVYRTTPARTGKMMVIMLGICIVGGAIFFSMWDYWLSAPPPVVAQMQGATETSAPVAATGKTINQDLKFVESEDGFSDLAFNALTGEEGHNPEFVVNSGDEITFTATNKGKGFHAFGIVASPDDFGNILWGSEIASASAPLKPGESGSTTFIAGAPGTYYYICTVPGHAALGMQASFIVE